MVAFVEFIASVRPGNWMIKAHQTYGPQINARTKTSCLKPRI